MQVIGIVGKAGSGKSTVAKRLIERHSFHQGKFARSLKLMLRTLLLYRGCPESVIDQMLEGDLKEVPSPYLCGKTPRWAMQSLGTEWGRECIGPDFWVQTEADHLNVDPGCPKDYRPARLVLDDVRFQNEVDLIRSLGGEIWEIFRPGAEALTSAGGHSSESLVVEPERRIENSVTKAELLAVVDMNVSALTHLGARSIARAK